jgi:hypothetical protein
LITTRNPDCGIHVIIGLHEFGRMETENAIILIFKMTGVQQLSDKLTRKIAKPVVLTLGYLVLVID